LTFHIGYAIIATSEKFYPPEYIMFVQILKYFFVILGLMILYEIIRGIVKSKIVLRLNKSAKRFIDRHDIKLEKYKFMNKFIVKQELMNDSEIHEAILLHAHENNLKIQDVEDLVEDYIEEIVPFFNLLSYYKIGYWIANIFLNMIYEVVIDHANAEKLKKIPPHNAVVFVMNHRSNVDYVLVAYMLARNISISYAVGEWARVWPLEYIFKSFGAYFLRRKFREKLYHLVLEKYIQMISLQGVTQGVFIEGGLTRDGSFRDTKVGVIDYIVKIKKNPEFKEDIIFVPVGINYDWVLEDRSLIKEWKKKVEKTGFKANIASMIRIVLRGPMVTVMNLFRYATGRLKQHGYASVSFGDPISVSKFLKGQTKDFFKLERHERLSIVKVFANQLLEKIGEVIPVTPVCLTSKAIMMLKKNSIKRTELIKQINDIKKVLKENKNRIVFGRAFWSSQESFRHLESERHDRQKELVSFEEELLDADEAEKMVEVALDILERRKLVKIKDNKITVNKNRKAFIEYYANSLNHLVR
jgi:glycerol-3-phosphate O-acyltransferase